MGTIALVPEISGASWELFVIIKAATPKCDLELLDGNLGTTTFHMMASGKSFYVPEPIVS